MCPTSNRKGPDCLSTDITKLRTAGPCVLEPRPPKGSGICSPPQAWPETAQQSVRLRPTWKAWQGPEPGSPGGQRPQEFMLHLGPQDPWSSFAMTQTLSSGGSYSLTIVLFSYWGEEFHSLKNISQGTACSLILAARTVFFKLYFRTP